MLYNFQFTGIEHHTPILNIEKNVCKNYNSLILCFFIRNGTTRKTRISRKKNKENP